MTLTDEQLATIRAALIAGRLAHCYACDEHGDDGMRHPEPSIQAAMEMLGMAYHCSISELFTGRGFKGNPWAGNEAFEPKPLTARPRST